MKEIKLKPLKLKKENLIIQKSNQILVLHKKEKFKDKIFQIKNQKELKLLIRLKIFLKVLSIVSKTLFVLIIAKNAFNANAIMI